MRATVPPRELAATITARAVLRAGWAVAISYLAICAFMVVAREVPRGNLGGMFGALGALTAVVCALIIVILRPGLRSGVLYLVVGTVASFFFAYVLLLGDQALAGNGLYLLNRIDIALLLVGPVTSKLRDGVWWCIAGYVLGLLALVSAQLVLHRELRPGWGPLLALTIYLVIIITLVLIRRSQRRFVPDFSAIDVEVARLSGRRELEERAVSLIHDTILNDLTIVSHANVQLDDRTRARITRDLAALAADGAEPETPLREHGGADFRDAVLAVIHGFQWRGLGVTVTGGESMHVVLESRVQDAITSAVWSCLDNVVQHSGSPTAEIFFDASDLELSVMVVDQGRGFDPESIPEDRLGVRHSVTSRIENCGGAVRLWSSPGNGTSIVMTVPVQNMPEETP